VFGNGMDDLRCCKHCGSTLPIGMFRRDRQYITYTCQWCYRSYLKNHRTKNNEKIKIQKAIWFQEHKHLFVERYHVDIQHKLRRLLRNRLYAAVVNNRAGSAVEDLGCSIEEFKKYIELKFQPGMTWKNWSKHGWHIDHIKPISSLNLEDPEQIKIACHYTNLQPLWASENWSKGDKC
jgi:hypothetical protein